MDLQIVLNEKYQSFVSSVSATGLSKFVVLTGRNGAGKSQFLRLLSGNHYASPVAEGITTIKIDSNVINSREVIHLVNWEMPGAPASGAGDVMNIILQSVGVINQILMGQPSYRTSYPILSEKQINELEGIATKLRDKGFNGSTQTVSVDDIMPLLSSDFDNHTTEVVNERIGRIIFRAHIEALQNKEDVPADKDPVNIFNNLCADFDMPFHLAPLTDIRYAYSPILHDEQGNKIDWSQLSAGEMVIFRIITWVFYYRLNHSLNPKLLLLDEPDAHLTPKMIRKFIDSIQNVLVDQMGVAVIMTTHSPNTVALTEEATLYELRKDVGNHAISKISKKDALQTFSEGLIFVQEKTKMVFLEGKADTPFYTKLYEIAVTKHDLTNQPPLNFIATSEEDPDEGGCTQVVKMVRRFDDSIISELVHGIIDRDKGNTPSQNVQVLSRYSIENYLYDPLVIVVAFIRNGRHKVVIPCIQNIDTNDIEKVLSNNELLQTAINEVLEHIKEHVEGELDETNVGVSVKTKYASSNIINYQLPQWFIDLKKSALMKGSLRKEQGQVLKPVESKEQLLALESAAIIHEDLFALLEDLVS